MPRGNVTVGKLLVVLLLIVLCLTNTAQATIYWDDDFESAADLTSNWTDYSNGFINGSQLFTSTGFAFTGTRSLAMAYTQLLNPGGPFMDRFTCPNCGGTSVGPYSDTFAVRFVLHPANNMQFDSTDTKIIYVRNDTADFSQCPGGFAGGLTGVIETQNLPAGMFFTLQGAYDATDTENITWGGAAPSPGSTHTYEMVWVMNTPGQSNGTLTFYVDGTQSKQLTGRQFRGPTPSSTTYGSQCAPSTAQVTNVRMFVQSGVGTLYVDRLATGNARINVVGGTSTTAPPAPTGLTVQ